MKTKRIAASALLLAAALVARAETAPVTVQGAWIRATVQGQTSTGGYMVLTASQPVVLSGVSTPVAGVAEVHEMKMEGDVMRMRAIESLPLPAGKPVELKPGSYHLMLTQLKAPLQPAMRVPVTLHFKASNGAASELQLSVPVAASRPAAP